MTIPPAPSRSSSDVEAVATPEQTGDTAGGTFPGHPEPVAYPFPTSWMAWNLHPFTIG